MPTALIRRPIEQPRPWPADKVERWVTASLTPYANNARTHSVAQIGQIAGSIREFGFTMPLLVDESGRIIAGHARLAAAQMLDLPEVPVLVARGWSEAQKKAYTIADNALTLNASWNDEMLVLEMQDLQKLGVDLALTGFSPFDIKHYLAGGVWAVDPNDIEQYGETLSGISGKIVITCAAHERQQVVGVLYEAIADAGIEAEVI